MGRQPTLTDHCSAFLVCQTYLMRDVKVNEPEKSTRMLPTKNHNIHDLVGYCMSSLSIGSMHVMTIAVHICCVCSSGYVMIRYKIASYLPRGSTHLPLPPYSVLAGVVQSMVQSGWVGLFQTNSSSHMVPCKSTTKRIHYTCIHTHVRTPHTHVHTADCTQVPELCSGCPNATTSDGLICKAAATCLGEDTDRDGIPNFCDSCPYNFNPNQSHTACEPIRGVCPGGVASDILWSQASVSTVDIKPCPAPMLGMCA